MNMTQHYLANQTMIDLAKPYIPADWDMFLFGDPNKKFYPKFSLFANRAAHPIQPPNLLGQTFHVVLIRHGWDFAKTVPQRRIVEHSMVDAVLLDPVVYGETCCKAGYEGII